MVLLAARLTGWKGQKVLIEAAATLRTRASDVAFMLAGDPQGRDAYVRDLDGLIAAKNLKGVVRRVGHCTDMPAAFLAASVVTVPSTEPEAFGRSAVEAQAMGTPVVVSDLGAVPETVLSPPAVAHERTGWRCPPATPARWPKAVGAALRSAPAPVGPGRPRQGPCGASFSLERMVAATLDVYSSLLDRPVPARDELTSRANPRNVSCRGTSGRGKPPPEDRSGPAPLSEPRNRRYEPFVDL